MQSITLFIKLTLGQQQLFNHGSIHDAHDQTQSETIQQPRANLEVIISDPLNMSNQYSIGEVNILSSLLFKLQTVTVWN